MKKSSLTHRVEKIEARLREVRVEPLGGDPKEGRKKLLAWVHGDGSEPSPNGDPDVKAYREFWRRSPPPSAEAMRQAINRYRQSLQEESWLDC